MSASVEEYKQLLLKENATTTTTTSSTTTSSSSSRSNSSKTLKTINLKWKGIGDLGTKIIANGLRNNSHVTALYLQGNNIGVEGCRDIGQMLQSNGTLEQLNIGMNYIGDEGVEAIVDGLVMAAVMGGDTRRTSSTTTTTTTTMATSLTRLNLFDNGIGVRGCCALERLLLLQQNDEDEDEDGYDDDDDSSKNNNNNTTTKVLPPLQAIDLGENHFGDNGTTRICRGLENHPTITYLNLFGCQIGPKGCRAIQQLLQGKNALTVLDLGYNRIGDEGAILLSKGLQCNPNHNKTITLMELDVHANDIRVDGCRAIEEMLRTNTSLQRLNLEGNYGYDDAATALPFTCEFFLALNRAGRSSVWIHHRVPTTNMDRRHQTIGLDQWIEVLTKIREVSIEGAETAIRLSCFHYLLSMRPEICYMYQ